MSCASNPWPSMPRSIGRLGAAAYTMQSQQYRPSRAADGGSPSNSPARSRTARLPIRLCPLSAAPLLIPCHVPEDAVVQSSDVENKKSGKNQPGVSVGIQRAEILAGAPKYDVASNASNAQKYIAFISRPETQAHFSELINYAPTNSRAFDHISAELALKLPTAPSLRPTQILQNYHFWNSVDQTGATALSRSVSEWERWIAKA
jgi:hypothetical protein